MATIHKFKIAGIDGQEIDFADFKGKKILVVNVASECGYTSQYQQLQELSEEYATKLIIVGVPSNDFGGQEPGTSQEIRSFCTRNYGVTFPLAAKLSITGANPAPLYQWLTSKAENGQLDSTVKWNFQKYLLDENGQLINCYPSSVSPIDEVLLAAIDAN